LRKHDFGNEFELLHEREEAKGIELTFDLLNAFLKQPVLSLLFLLQNHVSSPFATDNYLELLVNDILQGIDEVPSSQDFIYRLSFHIITIKSILSFKAKIVL